MRGLGRCSLVALLPFQFGFALLKGDEKVDSIAVDGADGGTLAPVLGDQTTASPAAEIPTLAPETASPAQPVPEPSGAVPTVGPASASPAGQVPTITPALEAPAGAVPTVGPASASPAGPVPNVTPALAAPAGSVSKKGFQSKTRAMRRLTNAPAVSDAVKAQRLAEIGTDCCVGTTILTGTSDVELVVAVTPGSDVSWLAEVPYKAYLVSNVDASGYQRLANPEHATAGSYIAWIIQYYDSLPTRMAFINSRRSWPFAFRERIDDVITNMTITATDFKYQPLSSRWYAVHYDPSSIRDISTFLNEPNLPIAGVPVDGADYSYGCCNTFAAASSAVQHLTKDAWMKLYWWLESHPRTERKRFTLEFSWHVLFGELPAMTPPDPRTLCPTNPALCQTFLDVGSKDTPSELAFHTLTATQR